MAKAVKTPFSATRVCIDVDGDEYLLIRPGITLTGYLDTPLAKTCAAAADLIDLYFSVVPRTVMRSYYSNNGYYRKISDRQFKKDMAALRRLPDDYKGYRLEYSEGESGQAGTHAIFIKALERDEDSPNESSVVRLEFPEDIVTTWGEALFLEFVAQAFQLLPFTSGHVGLAFKRSQVMEDEALEVIERLAPRYIGFDLSDDWLSTNMRGYTMPAHWISVLGPELSARLGGADGLERLAEGAEIRKLSNGTWLRGARLPPAGDVNRGTGDIGLLPKVARALRPTRCPDPECSFDEFDIDEWFARFDDLADQNWDNT